MPDASDLATVADLPAAVRRAARRWPDRVAWTFDPGGELTFADLLDVSQRLAGRLAAAGVRPGDRVGVMLGNCPEFPLLWLALAHLGGVMVAMNPRYGAADVSHVLDVAPCRLVIGAEPRLGDLASAATSQNRHAAPTVRNVAQLVAPHADGITAPDPIGGPGATDPGSSLNVQFTSGTTGLPKGCLLSHRYWVTLARSLVAEFPYLNGSDVMLTAQAFHYIDPMWNVAVALLAGARLVVLDGFHPSSFWAKVREHGVTYFYCLGAMPTLLLTQPPAPHDRHHQVRAIQCSAIPPQRHAELEARWGAPWYEAFGMTETGADLRVTDVDHDELVGSGCVGRPTGHRRARILGRDGRPARGGEIGELQLHGPAMMDGYLGDPSATAAAWTDDGWFRTGDLARLDVAGRVYLAGRAKDMIRRGGENIAAREVEDVLMSHPEVRLAAVVPVADELRGEEARAVVVAAGVSAEDLIAFLRARLAPHKVPRFWEFRDEVPLTPSMRVAKSQLGPPVGPMYDRMANV